MKSTTKINTASLGHCQSLRAATEQYSWELDFNTGVTIRQWPRMLSVSWTGLLNSMISSYLKVSIKRPPVPRAEETEAIKINEFAEQILEPIVISLMSRQMDRNLTPADSG